jgi:hypothetical protein
VPETDIGCLNVALIGCLEIVCVGPTSVATGTPQAPERPVACACVGK